MPGAFPTSFARSGVACIAVIFLAGLAGGAGAAGKAAAKQAGGTGVPTGKEAATDKKPYFNLQDSIAAERARLRALPGRTGLLEEESPTPTPAFSRPALDGELWVLVLEKAWAKVCTHIQTLIHVHMHA